MALRGSSGFSKIRTYVESSQEPREILGSDG